jgi:hypothetical protein
LTGFPRYQKVILASGPPAAGLSQGAASLLLSPWVTSASWFDGADLGKLAAPFVYLALRVRAALAGWVRMRG